MKEKTKEYRPYKSKIKVKKDSDLGMYVLQGESLTRTDVNGLSFYDKQAALSFKLNQDRRDEDFYRENFTLYYNK